MMLDNILFPQSFLLACTYSVLLAALMFGVCRIVGQRTDALSNWRDLWWVLMLCCTLPIAFTFIPSNATESSNIFTFHLAPIVEPSSVAFESMDIRTLESSSLSELQTLSSIWLPLYFLVAAGFLFRFFLSVSRIRNLVRLSKSIYDDSLEDSGKMIQALRRLHRLTGVSIVVTHQPTSPFVFGVFHPILVLSESSLENLSYDQMRLIVKHELVHIRRKDNLVYGFSSVLLCLCWFNYFMHAFSKSLDWAIETSCDAAVLNRHPLLRRTYALVMLKVLRLSATPFSEDTVATFSSTRQRSLSMRIKNIMNPTGNMIKSRFKKAVLWTSTIGVSIGLFILQPKLAFAEITTLSNPVPNARVSSNYGADNKMKRFHKGIDLAIEAGTAIYSAAEGVVVTSTDHLKGHRNYGKIIIIEHKDGVKTLYSHLQDREVNVGDRVAKGDVIGKVGMTGKTTGPHLHLEVIEKEERVDPNLFISF